MIYPRLTHYALLIPCSVHLTKADFCKNPRPYFQNYVGKCDLFSIRQLVLLDYPTPERRITISTMATSTTSALKVALTPPPGTSSDRKHQPNLLWEYNIIAQAVCMTVAGILFLLRCHVRLGFSRMPKEWILEDCKSASSVAC